MASEGEETRTVPRIVPTPQWIQAVQGIWKMNGELLRLQAESETGVLVALDSRGEQVNPLRVISRGTKQGD